MSVKPVKPGIKTSEFWGTPVSTALITSGVSVLLARPEALNQVAVVGAGLGLVAAGVVLQVAYTLTRSKAKSK